MTKKKAKKKKRLDMSQLSKRVVDQATREKPATAHKPDHKSRVDTE